MIRVIAFLLLIGALALGIVFVADRPGDVAVTWQGWRIETSVLVAVAAFLAVLALCIFFWSVLRTIVRSPREFRVYLQRRREQHSRAAISHGLIAIGAGDAKAARKHAQEARRLAPDEPLSLLLEAQTAQLTGDRDIAQSRFRQMAERHDTKLLGLHGLFIEARRRQDAPAARLYAEEAARLAPALPWAGTAVLQFRSLSGDWDGALEILDRNYKSAVLAKADYARQRAVLLTAQAIALTEQDRDKAKAGALDAAKLAPDLVPAAALAGRFLAEAGDIRKASRLIAKAWTVNPHPDLAEAYAHVRFGDTARDRLARIETLAAKAPGHLESALAVARAAIDAQEFARAREALASHLSQPTQRVAVLMAELEDKAEGDAGRVREWMARAVRAARDSAWIADGYVSDRWQPMSPISGRLDAFEWRAPLGELGPQEPAHLEAVRANDDGNHRRDMIEARSPEPQPLPASSGREEPAATREESAPAETLGAEAAQSKPGSEPPRTPRRPAADAIIPIIHAPDDPGPDNDLEPEVVPETGATWRRSVPS